MSVYMRCWRIRERTALFAIVMVALAVRVALMVYLEAYIIETESAFGYETGRIAKAIATGQGFSSPFPEPTGATAWLMPIYPLVLGLIFEVFGVYTTTSAVVILLFNCMVSALVCIPIFWIAREVFGRASAFFTALGWALYPPSIWHAINTIWDTSLLTLLIAMLIYGFYRLQYKSTLGNITVFGVAMGFVVLVNPVVLSCLPFVWLWILTRTQRSAIWRCQAATLVALGMLLMVLPWLLRNFYQFDRPFLRSNLGLELKLGNSTEAWADFLVGFHEDSHNLGHPYLDKKEFEHFVRLGEVRYLDQQFAEALTFIRDHPTRFLRMTLKRIAFFWLSDLGRPNNYVGNLTLSTPSLSKQLLYLIPLPFLVVGIFTAIKRKFQVTPLLVLLIFFPVIYYVTHIRHRYRSPIEPYILMFSIYGAMILSQKCRCLLAKSYILRETSF